jgi:F-type H+-transporting ATPase subunit b
MTRTIWGFCIAALLLAWGVSASGQERPDGKQPAGQAPPSQQKKAPAHEPGFGAQLAEASNAAAGEGEENAEFKFSPSVHWFAGVLHSGLRTAYWISVFLNFAVIAAVVAVLWRANVPAMFRQRTAGIQQAMTEAARASEDAARRLTEIEKRLAQLDANIAAMQQQAERESAHEEERLREAAGEDAQRVFQAAEQEIAAAAKAARRDLVAFAADLSVSLAQKRMHVDPQADQALVRSFAQELGSNSFAPSPDGGKDGR